MVSIPTTERQHYNFQPKVNTFYLAADTAYNHAKEVFKLGEKYQDYKVEEERTKMDSLTTQARLDMNKATNDWRIANESNPDDPEALKELNAQYDDIMNSYREQLSPYSRKAWDTQITTKLKGAYSLENQAWAFKQVQTNAANHIKNEVKNYNDLAFSYGSSGSDESLGAALADFASMTDKLTTFGAKNLGVETAAQMLNGAEIDYVKSYINGVASVDTAKALQELEDPRVRVALGSNYDTAMKVIRAAQRQEKYDNDTRVYAFQNKLQDEIDAMSPTEAMKHLNQNMGEVTESFYKSQVKAIEKRAGLTAETSAEKYAEIFKEINVPMDSPEAKLAHNMKMQEKIINAYADLDLTLADKKALLKFVNEDKQADSFAKFYKNASSDTEWFSYDNKEAIEDIEKAFPHMLTRNQALMTYAKNLGDLQIDNKDVSGEDKKKIVQEVIRLFQKKELNDAVRMEKTFTPVPKGKEFTSIPKEAYIGRVIGNFKIVGVR